ncbi:MAG: T9SS type A sorting domain-containing protein [Bacteroidetes bacterium]|nr:T9SS type A sorting domain-containing protein [Bacteroidota bacterium]
MMKNLTEKITKTVGLIVLTAFGGLMTAQTMSWSQAGPVYGAGRARNMVVDKNDASGNTLYLGSTTSGIFKTVNGGVKWFPVNDSGSVRNISYLAQSANGTIYAATGEGFLRGVQRTKAQPGSGLYKLNSNNSLAMVASSSVVGTVINRVACSPVNANVIAVAGNKGILVSTDGGANFTAASGVTTTSLTTGMDVKFDGTGVLYCSIGSERGDGAGAASYSAVASTVWKSSDASLSAFANITPTNSALVNARYGRIELAVAPSNNNVIYASCAKKLGGSVSAANTSTTAGLAALFISYDAGATWGMALQGSGQLDPLSSDVDYLILSSGGGIGLTSGDYAHVITVHPTNPDVLFIGSYAFSIFMKTGGTNQSPTGILAGAATWLAQNNPLYIHQNIHDIKVIGSGAASSKFYFVTDAGVYRSIDLSNTLANPNVNLPSYQPFYKGLVTGQFNSVSIQRYPVSTNTNVANGNVITPYSGFIGGTNGNGLNYYSGTDTLVSQEVSYFSNDIYNAEFSKILPDAALFASGTSLFKNTNVKATNPEKMGINAYQGSLANYSSVGNYGFDMNDGFQTTGIPFKLWEYYAQTPTNPDVVVFYNDSLRQGATISGTNGAASLITQTTFTFDIKRPDRFAVMDSIVIRTGTVTVGGIPNYGSVPTPFTGTDRQDVTIKLINPSNTVTLIPSTSVAGNVPVSTTGVTLNAVSLTDKIAITYSLPPFGTKTITQYPQTGAAVVTDPSIYYRVFATVFYKYSAGDSVYVADNSIATKPAVYGTTLSVPLSWAYGSASGISQTITANQYPAVVSNPTYVLVPGNVSQTTPVFTVNAAGAYTISQFGTYKPSANAVPAHTITAETPTTAPTTSVGPSYTLSSTAGTIAVQSVGTFTLSSLAAGDYTITAVDDEAAPTETVETYVTVEVPTYTALPDNIIQTNPQFTLTATAPTVYTLQGSGSYTLSSSYSVQQVFTSTSSVASYSTNVVTPPVVRTVAANTVVPFSKNNPIVKVPVTGPSARLAAVFKHTDLTKNEYAVIISKNPLDMTNPMEAVMLSANGCLTTKADGTPDDVNTVTVDGKPTILEWSKSGTELYYATDANKVYRVSYINMIMDMSPASYSGKLNTDVFTYRSMSAGWGFDLTRPNLNSPYRTALIGSFTKPITSISVSNDDQNVVLTFNDPTGALIMTNTLDARTSNTTNIGWTSKAGTLSNIQTYCSLIEKSDKNTVFIGTDKGLFYTKDLSAASPTWKNTTEDQTSPMPNVQVFDIKQQVLENYQCYNSGIIYVATNGRGIWQNRAGYKAYVVGVSDFDKAQAPNNLSIYPNPANGNVTIAFNSHDDERAVLNVMDINGRIVKSQDLGKINAGEITYSFNVAELSAGVYIVSVNSNVNVKRVTKLIVTK